MSESRLLDPLDLTYTERQEVVEWLRELGVVDHVALEPLRFIDGKIEVPVFDPATIAERMYSDLVVFELSEPPPDVVTRHWRVDAPGSARDAGPRFVWPGD